jgi:hypothetical protein
MVVPATRPHHQPELDGQLAHERGTAHEAVAVVFFFSILFTLLTLHPVIYLVLIFCVNFVVDRSAFAGTIPRYSFLL